MIGAAIALLVLAAPALAEGDEKLGLAVLDVQPSGDAPAGLGATVAGLAASQLDKSGVFRVLSEDDVKRMVSFDQMKTALSCDDQASCLSEIGSALGVPFLLTGTLAKVGSSLVLNLVLIDLEKARSLRRESAQYASLDALLAGLPTQVERVTADLLYRQKGRLVVTATEEGATVAIDGQAIGTLPMPEQEVASGPHRVGVSKEGFIRSEVDVRIEPKKVTRVEAKLQPSPEFLAAYKQRTGTSRAIAWGTTIGAGALVVAGAGLFAGWYVALEPDRKRQGGGFVVDEVSNDATALTVNTLAGVGWASLALAPVSAGAAAFFWATGEDPDRYGG